MDGIESLSQHVSRLNLHIDYASAFLNLPAESRIAIYQSLFGEATLDLYLNQSLHHVKHLGSVPSSLSCQYRAAEAHASILLVARNVREEALPELFKRMSLKIWNYNEMCDKQGLLPDYRHFHWCTDLPFRNPLSDPSLLLLRRHIHPVRSIHFGVAQLCDLVFLRRMRGLERITLDFRGKGHCMFPKMWQVLTRLRAFRNIVRGNEDTSKIMVRQIREFEESWPNGQIVIDRVGGSQIMLRLSEGI